MIDVIIVVFRLLLFEWIMPILDRKYSGLFKFTIIFK